MKNNLKLGQEIRFVDCRNVFYVRSLSERFAICTTKMMKIRPYKALTNYYTILNFEQGLRNKDNRVFSIGYETQEQCDDALKDLESGELTLSHRNPLPIVFKKIGKRFKNKKEFLDYLAKRINEIGLKEWSRMYGEGNTKNNLYYRFILNNGEYRYATNVGDEFLQQIGVLEE